MASTYSLPPKTRNPMNKSKAPTAFPTIGCCFLHKNRATGRTTNTGSTAAAASMTQFIVAIIDPLAGGVRNRALETQRALQDSAAALQTGQALCGVNQFDESRFVRGERLADRCGREPARERGPAVNVGRPNPLGGITNAVAEQQSELGDRGGKW